MSAEAIPLHPERSDDPRTLHWRVRHTVGHLPGEPPPAPLTALVSSGVLGGYEIGLDLISTTLAPDRSWHQDGPAVRTAVQASVREHRQRLDGAGPAERDVLLTGVAEQVIAAVVAPVATAHGGQITCVGAVDGVLSVRLTGACHGCPASALTLHQRLEHALRERLPWIRGVRSADEPAPAVPVRRG